MTRGAFAGSFALLAFVALVVACSGGSAPFTGSGVGQDSPNSASGQGGDAPQCLPCGQVYSCDATLPPKDPRLSPTTLHVNAIADSPGCPSSVGAPQDVDAASISEVFACGGAAKSVVHPDLSGSWKASGADGVTACLDDVVQGDDNQVKQVTFCFTCIPSSS